MKQSHRSSNYFFRKSPSHYHMMLIVMSAYKSAKNISNSIRGSDLKVVPGAGHLSNIENFGLS